jgi:hypothetical protein
MNRVNSLIERMSENQKYRIAHSRIQDIRLCSSYAEPGYDDPDSGCIAFGNWNSITRWNRETKTSETIDETMPKLAKLLERMGVELEWIDEWAECCDCGRAVRTEPDSYSWIRSYVDTDDGTCCEECTAKHATYYLESIEGNDSAALTLESINPTEHDYVLLESGFENGCHSGQDSDPGTIGRSLREMGITRYFFKLDSVRQFDVSFSVYVHTSEFESIDSEKWATAAKNGSSVSQGLERALRAASEIMSRPAVGIQVISCDVTTGEARAKMISPQDFIDGKAFREGD